MASITRSAIMATTGRDYGKLGQGKDETVALDLSTAPAWIGLPDLSGVDLAQTQTFPVDKKVQRRKRRWDEDWRELVIGASPYNRVSEPCGPGVAVAIEMWRTTYYERNHHISHNVINSRRNQRSLISVLVRVVHTAEGWLLPPD